MNLKSCKEIQINPSNNLLKFNGSPDIINSQNLLRNKACYTSDNDFLKMRKPQLRA